MRFQAVDKVYLSLPQTTIPKGWIGRWHEVPEGVTVFKPFSLPQSPIGDSPLVRGGHDKRLF